MGDNKNFPAACRSGRSPFDIRSEVELDEIHLADLPRRRELERPNRRRRKQIYGEYRQLVQQLQTGGQYVAGDELQVAETASSVRVRDGKPLVTDGPFAETREQIGGFFVVEAKDQDEAEWYRQPHSIRA